MNDSNYVIGCSRKEAIEDRIQVLATPSVAKEAGFTIPIYFTATAWDKYVKVPKEFGSIENEKIRLIRIFNQVLRGISKCGDVTTFNIEVPVNLTDKGNWESNEERITATKRSVTLKVDIGPMDYNDPAPVITIYKPQED